MPNDFRVKSITMRVIYFRNSDYGILLWMKSVSNFLFKYITNVKEFRIIVNT